MASGGEEPIIVEQYPGGRAPPMDYGRGGHDPTATMPVPPTTSAECPHHSLSDGELYLSDSEERAIASKGIAVVHVRVEWRGQEAPKWEMWVKMALQTWLTKMLKGKVCEVGEARRMPGPFCLRVEITPPAVLKTLLELKSASLEKISRDNNKNYEATVSFSLVETSSHLQGLPYGSADTSPHTEPIQTPVRQPVQKVSGAEKKDEDVALNDGGTSEDPGLKVPLFQFLYLNQVYRKEMERIVKEHGVNISYDVRISITPKDPTKSHSLSKATEEFTDLFQKRTADFSGITILPSQLDTDIMKETMKNIQTEEAQMMINMSAQSYMLFGPQERTSMISRRLPKESGLDAEQGGRFGETPWNTGTKKSDSEWHLLENTIHMDIQDPLTTSAIFIHQIHWELMKAAHERQINEIQNKFGVQFNSDSTSQGTLKISAQSRGQKHSLEANALRALMHLHQRVAMTTASCSLKDPAESEDVKKIYNSLRSQHPCIKERHKNGLLELVGVPEHLHPAVNEIEGKLSRCVFDDRERQLIGLPGGFSLKDHGKQQQPEDNCCICLCSFKDKEKLKCGHEFCRECLEKSVDSIGAKCPSCMKVFGRVEGNQPDGSMRVHTVGTSLDGFKDCGSIVINYEMPSGKQTAKHPNPGKPYRGTQREAYLPDNQEGREVLQLLKRAFDQRLIFTVGTSRTTGQEDSVTWNDIHHKTNKIGGANSFSYPDDGYLKRVREELKAQGIE